MILHCFLVKKIAEKRLNFKHLYSVINIFHLRTQNLFPFFFLLLKKKVQTINMYFYHLYRKSQEQCRSMCKLNSFLHSELCWTSRKWMQMRKESSQSSSGFHWECKEHGAGDLSAVVFSANKPPKNFFFFKTANCCKPQLMHSA